MSTVENVVIFGSTGGTGQLLVKEALKHGYNIRAVARTPDKLRIKHEQLHTFKAHIYDEESVSKAIEGQDAVLVSLSPGGLSLREKTDIYTQSASVIIPAMQQQRVHRLLVISTMARRGVSWGNHPIFEFGIKRIFWKTLYSNIVMMDDMIMATDLNWTMVRPPGLTNKPYSGEYRVGTGKYALPGGLRLGRSDLAEAMINLIDKADSFRNNVAVAY